MLVEWNETRQERPRDLCIHDLFVSQARRTPDALAVTGGGEELTYAELSRRSGRLAARLRRLGVRRGDLTGLCVERSAAMLVGMIPMAIGAPGEESNAALARAVIGGVLVGTVSTLLFVPYLYSIVGRFEGKRPSLLNILHQVEEQLYGELLARVPAIELVGVVRRQEEPLFVGEIEPHLDGS